MCNCNGQCGSCGLMSGLMGELSLPPVWPGDRFQFGFEEPTLTAAFSSPGSVAGYLENEGLSYDTVSYELSGVVHPYIAVEGRSALYWDSGSDLRDTIYNVIAANYGIRAGTVQFSSETHPEGYEAPQVSSTGRPGTGANADRSGLPGQCDWNTQSFTDYVACQLGITPGKAAMVGVIGALVGVILIAKIAR